MRRKKSYRPPSVSFMQRDSKNASGLIESILNNYNQHRDEYNIFDQNIIELLVKRNTQRNSESVASKTTFFFRLQWLAIGLVIDRLFFYLYFTATLVSYVVTLWLIPYSHPNLTIDVTSL